jgi:small-conductance mechanosensitive channel
MDPQTQKAPRKTIRIESDGSFSLTVQTTTTVVTYTQNLKRQRENKSKSLSDDIQLKSQNSLAAKKIRSFQDPIYNNRAELNLSNEDIKIKMRQKNPISSDDEPEIDYPSEHSSETENTEQTPPSSPSSSSISI